MAKRFCKQCGRELAEGKRFCGGCGAAVAGPPPRLENPPAPSSAGGRDEQASTQVCSQCGARLQSGKAFCGKCGQAVQASAVLAVKEMHGPAPNPPEEPGSPEAPRAAAATPTMAVPLPSDRQTQPAPEEPARTRQDDAESEQPPRPNGTLWITMGTIAALVAVAASVWGWYAYSHRKAEIATGHLTAQQSHPSQPSQPSPPPPQGPPPSSPALPGSAPAQKPDDGTAEIVPPPRRPAPRPRVDPPAPAPAPVPAPAADPATASGLLHYQGPPVPMNGQVVFDHLPAAQLKFAFDRQSWALTIKRNPDGTKRVVLTSLRPGAQSTCDLRWEIVN